MALEHLTTIEKVWGLVSFSGLQLNLFSLYMHFGIFMDSEWLMWNNFLVSLTCIIRVL